MKWRLLGVTHGQSLDDDLFPTHGFLFAGDGGWGGASGGRGVDYVAGRVDVG